MNTGLVSPQIHVTHYPTFDTAKQQDFKSVWQILVGFTFETQVNNPTSKGTSKKGKRSPTATSFKVPIQKILAGIKPGKMEQVPGSEGDPKRQTQTLLVKKQHHITLDQSPPRKKAKIAQYRGPSTE